jgi:hypothetical protein
MPGACGHVYGPVAGGTHIAGAATLKGLIGADFVAQIAFLGFFRVQLLAELVIETLIGKITLIFGHPFMEPHMRPNHEFTHVSSKLLPTLNII